MLKLLSKIRFLPLTIFAATLLLTVKVGNIWYGFDKADHGAIQISGAIAQTDTEVANPKDIDQIAKKKVNGDAKAGAKITKTSPLSDLDSVKEEQSKLITEDPTLLTQAEIDLLQKLSERRRVWELREQELKTFSFLKES